MRTATFIGPIAHLRGKTALVRDHSRVAVLAQFDDRDATLEGLSYLRNPTRLGFGWHAFPIGDFQYDA